jgi:hypothetical protein
MKLNRWWHSLNQRSSQFRSQTVSTLATVSMVVALGATACDSVEPACEGAACPATDQQGAADPGGSGSDPGSQSDPGAGSGGNTTDGGGNDPVGGGGSSDDPGAGQGNDPVDNPGDDPIDNPGDDPIDNPGDDPIDNPGDDPIDNPGDDPIDNPGDDPIDNPGDDPIDDPGDDPIDNPGDDPVEEPGEDPVDDGLITLDELEPFEIERINQLRDAIQDGLGRGRDHYLDYVTLALANSGLIAQYDTVLVDGWQTLQVGIAECPFAKYYGNVNAQVISCEYLADLAKVEAYSDLGQLLDTAVLPSTVKPENEVEALFWQEQGAISGLEEQRVIVMADLAVQGYCNEVPTPVASSAEKGYTEGRQLMIQKINDWLAAQGHKADYPVMSSKIQVCNMNGAAIDPARQAAIAGIAPHVSTNPLCPGYQAPTQEAALQFSQAEIDYKNSIKKGIEDEYALAAVKIFQVVPCNVGDPLVVDLDGDGVELRPIHDGVDFDFWSTGRKQAVAWVHSDDAFLALDRDGDGIISKGAELFGNFDRAHADGFAHLATLDAASQGGNGNGVLDQGDAAFPHLVVWRDANGDGNCGEAELSDLTSAGVSAIPLSAASVSHVVAGNPVLAVTYAEGARGPVLIADAYLRQAPWARVASRD